MEATEHLSHAGKLVGHALVLGQACSEVRNFGILLFDLGVFFTELFILVLQRFILVPELFVSAGNLGGEFLHFSLSLISPSVDFEGLAGKVHDLPFLLRKLSMVSTLDGVVCLDEMISSLQSCSQNGRCLCLLHRKHVDGIVELFL